MGTDGIGVSTGVCNFLLGSGIVGDKDDDIVEATGCRCEEDEAIGFETVRDCDNGDRHEVDSECCLVGDPDGGDRNCV